MIVNLTPHDINFLNKDGSTIAIYPSRGNIRIKTDPKRVNEVDGISIYKTEVLEMDKLPPVREGTIYIVSFMVKERAIKMGRLDFYSPAALVRNNNGVVIGCLGLEP
jgi:hypothetical protein